MAFVSQLNNCAGICTFAASSTGIKMKGQNRSDVKRGREVAIVLKEDQISGKLTEGIVQDILTNSLYHPHGIKVRLTTGEVGRVKRIKPLENNKSTDQE